MSKNRGYSNEFHLSVLPADGVCREGLINEVRYADGTVRQIGYDQNGSPNRFVDTDGSIWNRAAAGNRWESDRGESFNGTIEVVPVGSADNVAGSISVRVFEGAFLCTERMYFPIGIMVVSRFSRDGRMEVEREVSLLNGKKLSFRRESRNGLWFRHDGDVVHQPENAFQYGLPWKYPAVALALV